MHERERSKASWAKVWIELREKAIREGALDAFVELQRDAANAWKRNNPEKVRAKKTSTLLARP